MSPLLALMIAQTALLAGILAAVLFLFRKRPSAGIAARKESASESAPASSPTEAAAPAAVVRKIVRAAVAERLEHEKERPERYPLDQRTVSILQRAKRQMHFDKVTPPSDDDLRALIAEQVQEQR